MSEEFAIRRITPVTLTDADAVETGPATGVFMTGPALRVDFEEYVNDDVTIDRVSFIASPAGLSLLTVGGY